MSLKKLDLGYIIHYDKKLAHENGCNSDWASDDNESEVTSIIKQAETLYVNLTCIKGWICYDKNSSSIGRIYEIEYDRALKVFKLKKIINTRPKTRFSILR